MAVKTLDLIDQRRSAFAKLETLSKALELLCSSLSASTRNENKNGKIVGADSLFPAVCYLCAKVSSDVDLVIQIEYISILSQVPSDIFENCRLDGKFEYTIMTFRAAMHALETLGPKSI